MNYFLVSEIWSSDFKWGDRHKVAHESPPCMSIGVLKKEDPLVQLNRKTVLDRMWVDFYILQMHNMKAQWSPTEISCQWSGSGPIWSNSIAME